MSGGESRGDESPGQRSAERRREPRRVRLPGFIHEADVGLGDVVKRVTSVMGIKACGPCAERAARLNSWLVFAKRR
jgi:hypothetical protein